MDEFTPQQRAALVIQDLCVNKNVRLASSLARMVGLSLRGMLYLLHSLADIGLVEQDPETRHWRRGRGMTWDGETDNDALAELDAILG